MNGLVHLIKSFEIAAAKAAISGHFDDLLLAMSLNPLIHSDNDARIVARELLLAHREHLSNFAAAIDALA